ncbi:MAG: CAP domain-containing protein [Pseudomonadota bacterium]
MPSYLFLLVLGALGAAGGGGSSSGASTGRVAGNDDDGSSTPPVAPMEDAPEPAPVSPMVVSLAPASDAPDLPASAYDIGWPGLSAEEQLMVELVNRARLDPEGELERQDEGFAAGVTTEPKEALAVVPSLSDAADAHSQDMDDRDFFSHTNPDGESPADRAVEAGHGSGYVGENIGWIGSTSTSFDEQARVESHHDNLWDSDGHQQNFMSDNWNEIGVGYDYGSYRGYDGSTFATEMFGDRGETYLTGVVIDDQDGDDFYDIGEGVGGVQITAYRGEEAYGTATWDAGGYTLALPPGDYRVVFEGGGLDAAYETGVTIGDENVKLDIIDDGGAVAASLSAGSVPDPALIPTVDETSNDPLIAMAEADEDTMVIF